MEFGSHRKDGRLCRGDVVRLQRIRGQVVKAALLTTAAVDPRLPTRSPTAGQRARCDRDVAEDGFEPVPKGPEGCQPVIIL